MAVLASPRYRRVFAQLQTGSLRQVNNSSGTWTSTGAKFIRVPANAIDFTANVPITPVPWLTGTRSMQPGIRGRKNGSVSLRNVPLIPSGAAGTAPDIDPILQNTFGAAPTIVASTSVAYNFADAGFLPLTLLDFMHSQTTLTSRLAWGCFCSGFEITLNGDVLTCSFSFVAGYVLDSTTFSAEDTTGKAALTAWPTEPSSPTYNGSIIPGFGAVATLDSNSMETQIRSLTIRGTTGVQLVGDILADGYPAISVGGARTMGISLGVVDDDSTSLNNLKQKAKANTAPTINASITVGTTAGSKVKFDINAMQLISPAMADEENLVMANFPESAAHATGIGNTDDLVMTFL